MNHCHLTEKELRNVHSRFSHRSVQKPNKVLKRETGNKIGKHTCKLLRQIKQQCHYCQKFGAKPQRFKFTLRNDSISFKKKIYCDILKIEKVPVLHVVDESTRFQAATRLSNMTVEELCTALKACCINVYLGPPDIINRDAGTNFVARTFQEN